ncbi:unnamed protein product [Sphenostylis stenocarpa]|uniref:Peroxidase n=1 Tax=Sphenostylis stenocarpa TaxID=92480 RepID=A0AA86RYY6_9FABA|nr:unnamed protein product [Sphenostylis stenocarpa]
MKKIIIILLLFCFILPLAFGELKVGFYESSCQKAESIVKNVVKSRFNRDKTITAALLRLHFHDCAVSGCDASILINSTQSNTAEKESGANFDVRGFDIIDEVKETLESACPSTVSCADIITLATRDAVALSGGPQYEVPTGRRDGLVSNINNVKIPGPSSSVSVISQFFNKSLGLTTQEMVTLFGAHTVGVARCSFFDDRLSSPDPTMDPGLNAKLVKLCSSRDDNDPSTPLDQKTSLLVDNGFYTQILAKKGVLQIDQQLALDQSTRGFVTDIASNGVKFQKNFANAMVKMGSIDVLVGNQGEIRQKCSVVNNHS